MTAPTKAAPFEYSKRPFNERELQRGKQYIKLGRTDIMHANIQVLREGGENNLHSHRYLDGFWMVLKGRVRFYGPDKAVLGEFGSLQGIVIPRGVPYWFERVGDEEAEILQVESHAISIPVDDQEILLKERVDHEPRFKNSTAPLKTPTG